MRAAFVGCQPSGVCLGLRFARIFVGRHAAVGVVEHAPDDAHANHLGRARACGLGLRRRLGFLLLGRRLFLALLVVSAGFFVLRAAFLLLVAFFFVAFLFFFVGFF